MYILMWCLCFFFFLPFHTHFLPFAPPLPPPFSVPAIVAPYLQPRGGQANRQLSPELIAKLVLQIIHRDAYEWYDWHVPPSRLPSTSSLPQVQPPGLGTYVSVPRLRPLCWQLRRYHYTTGLSRQYSSSFFSIHNTPYSYKMCLKRHCNIQYMLGSTQAFPTCIFTIIQLPLR